MSRDTKRRLRSNYKKSRTPGKEDKFYTKEDIFLSRLASILQTSTGKVKGMFSERSVSTIRLNPLAGDPEKILEKIKGNEWELEQVNWSPYTYIVKNKDKSELGKSQDYAKGLFYIQNLSSMLPVIILDPKEDEKVLDLCAAPGSKTTMIAALMKNRGKIVANDENFSRIEDLKDVLELFYVKNTEIRLSDGAKLGRDNKNSFDKVLLDAPCSGEGLIFLRGPKPLRFWSIKKVKAMSTIQKRLISSAFEAVRPGGTLVYATCTLEPAENEGVVSHLLENYPDAKVEKIDLTESEDFDQYKPFIVKGIKHWSQNSYNPEVEKSIRVIPGKRMQGFYVVKIKKGSA